MPAQQVQYVLNGGNEIFWSYILDSTKLGVWILDGDATHTGLLKYALTPDNFQDSAIVIAASLSQPWFLLKSITNWLNIITDHIDRIGISQDVMQQCKQKSKFLDEIFSLSVASSAAYKCTCSSCLLSAQLLYMQLLRVLPFSLYCRNAYALKC